jgi:hypothetical protein
VVAWVEFKFVATRFAMPVSVAAWYEKIADVVAQNDNARMLHNESDRSAILMWSTA